MNRGIDINVTFHEQSRQYRKQIGRQIGRNGEPKGKVWLLGSDEVAAKRKALAIQAEWEALKERGHVVWPNIKASGGSTSSPWHLTWKPSGIDIQTARDQSLNGSAPRSPPERSRS